MINRNQAPHRLRSPIGQVRQTAVSAALPDSGPTFSEFVQTRYIPYIKATKRSWKTDESLLRCHLLPHFGEKRLAEVNLREVEQYYHADIARGAAKGSANRRIILLRYLFNLGLRWEMRGVTKNPARGVKLLDPQNVRERYLSAGEMERLRSTISRSDNPMLTYIVSALLLTGMRKREVLDARWSDINFEQRIWHIPFTKSGKPRVVSLSATLIELLHKVPRRHDCPWVFANPQTGRPYCSIFYAWDTARKRAGLPEVRMHDLRHTFASILINSSFDLYDVMNALGHTQIRTTMRYAHLSRERKQAAVDAVARAITNAADAVAIES